MNQKPDNAGDEKLYHFYHVAAEVVSKYGDAYLPVFKSLHNEMQASNKDAQIKYIALRLASANVSLDSME